MPGVGSGWRTPIRAIGAGLAKGRGRSGWLAGLAPPLTDGEGDNWGWGWLSGGVMGSWVGGCSIGAPGLAATLCIIATGNSSCLALTTWYIPNTGMKSDKCLSCLRWNSIDVSGRLLFSHYTSLVLAGLLPASSPLSCACGWPHKIREDQSSKGRKNKMGLKTICSMVNETSHIIPLRSRNG